MPPAAPAAWPQATLGQLGQHGRVVGSRDQRVQHRPAGGAQHVAGDRAQLGSRRPPRPWPAAGPHGSARRSAPCGRGADRAAPGSAWAPRTRVGPGRAQPADRSTPSRPHRAWARARCAGGGIQQPALEVVFQQVGHRPPVHPGGLHPTTVTPKLASQSPSSTSPAVVARNDRVCCSRPPPGQGPRRWQ